MRLNGLKFDDEVSQLGDSLDVVELAIELEEEFQIEITSDLNGIETVADLIRLLRQRLDEREADEAA